MPICSTCNDTHTMTLDGTVVMCTRCPVPCQECRSDGRGPFCETTPCACTCHEESQRRLAAEAVAYLRAEADFNRSWADGRRGADRNLSDAYKARRLELAKEREHWANAIEALCKRCEELTR